ncbi:MAG: hypothetical protein ACLFTP_03805 [Rhodosalinus sp.]|uniref:hypothetical protein n=1 Tax=Rhodosalinus sp. TaxID=2047741 RepID=UPI00397DF1DA
MRKAPPLFAAALAAACAPQPMTPARAAKLCAEEARAADGVTGNIRAGMSSEGPVGGGRLTVTSAVLSPVREQDALNACIDRRLAGRPAPPPRGLSITIDGDFGGSAARPFGG